jgi:hypothetical protein
MGGLDPARAQPHFGEGGIIVEQLDFEQDMADQVGYEFDFDEMVREQELREAENARAAAIDQVERNADDEWKRIATEAVWRLAYSRLEFTTDDVWEELEGLGYSTHEPRAMGAVMRASARNGIICKTDRVMNSRRVQCHARPVAVWQSLWRTS